MKKLDGILAVLLSMIVVTATGAYTAFAIDSSSGGGSGVMPTAQVDGNKQNSSSQASSQDSSSSQAGSSSSSRAGGSSQDSSSSQASGSSQDSSSSQDSPSSSESGSQDGGDTAGSTTGDGGTSTQVGTTTRRTASSESSAAVYSAASHESASEASSQNWAALLSGVESTKSMGSVPDVVFSEADKGTAKSSGSEWLLIVGLLLIALAVTGIGFVVYMQFFSKKSAHKAHQAAKPAIKDTDDDEAVDIYSVTQSLHQQPEAPKNRKSEKDDYGDDYTYDAYVIAHDDDLKGRGYDQPRGGGGRDDGKRRK